SEGGRSPPPSSTPSAPPSRLLHTADEGLALVDRDVGIRDEGRELVGGVPRDEALIAPVKRHADVVDGAAGDRERAHPPRDERLAADAAARRRDRDPVGVADALLGGQLRA